MGLDTSNGGMSLSFSPNTVGSCAASAVAQAKSNSGTVYRAFVVPPGDYALSLFSSGVLPKAGEFAFSAPAGQVVFVGTFRVDVPRAERKPDGYGSTANWDILSLDRTLAPGAAAGEAPLGLALAQDVPVVSAVASFCTF